MTYAEYAAAYRERGFAPIPVKGKAPVPAGSTGSAGTVTDEKIAEWIADPSWGAANLALRIEGYIVLDADQYGEKHGAEQLAELESELGALPATITNTSRGKDSDSRQYFYLIPGEMEFATKAAPDVDVLQRRHRYSVSFPSIHPVTGDQYIWYGYDGEPLEDLPSVGDFEMLPDAWVEHLLNLKPAVIEGVQSVNENKPTKPTETELRKLTAIRERLSAIPREWREGAGWHDAVYHSACWMWRMIQHNDYNLTEMAGRTLLIALTPTYPQWGEDKVLEQWESARQSTLGQLEPTPAESIPPLLPELVVMNDLPELTSHNRPFLDLLTTQPEDKGVGALAERRATVAREVLAAGLSVQQALTAVWISKAARSVQRETGGLESLWREVEQVSREFEKRSTALADAPAAVIPATPVPAERAHGRAEFLSLDERIYLEEHGSWWGTRYVEWTASRLPQVNLPYSRMNRWTVLALVFSPYAHLLRDDGNLDLNLFQMNLGPSSTGKTRSKKLLREAIKACFPPDASPSIGGSLSKEALTKVLIQRDGQSTWLHKDEVDGLLKEIQGTRGNWNEGMIQMWADIYEGIVDPIYRQGDAESSGIEAKSYLTMHLMGVESEVTEVIDAKLWKSGFMPRFVFALGDPPDGKRHGRKLTLASEKLAKEGDPMPRQWGAEFNAIRERFSMRPVLPVPVQITTEANARWEKFDDLTWRLIEGHQHESRLEAVRNRFVDSIIKCTALVALSEGETTITLRHLLIALEQAEEWWSNAVYMVNATDETPFIRNVNEIERLIASKPKRQAKLAVLNRESRHDAQTMKRLVDQLLAEDRVLKYTVQDLDTSEYDIVQIKELEAA